MAGTDACVYKGMEIEVLPIGKCQKLINEQKPKFTLKICFCEYFTSGCLFVYTPIFRTMLFEVCFWDNHCLREIFSVLL